MILAAADPTHLALAIAFVGGLMVLMCLKSIADHVRHETEWHDLRVQVRELRARQAQRLQALGLKSRRS